MTDDPEKPAAPGKTSKRTETTTNIKTGQPLKKPRKAYAFSTKEMTRKERRRQQSINNSKAMQLIAKGDLSIAEVARASKVSEGTVKRIKQKYAKLFKELKNVDEYKNIKSDLLSAAELTLLKSLMTPGKLRKAPLNQVAFAFKEINVANRLERGLSTSNSASQVQYIGANLPASNKPLDVGQAQTLEPLQQVDSRPAIGSSMVIDTQDTSTITVAEEEEKK